MRICHYCGRKLTSLRNTFTVITHNRREGPRWFCNLEHLKTYFNASQSEKIIIGRRRKVKL